MRLLIIFFSLAICNYLHSQDIEAFGKRDNYGINGNINVGYNFYSVKGRNQLYVPHGLMVTGGLQGRLGAIEIPISFTYSRVDKSISAPFNMVGASPYYKWVKLHLGHRSLNFSPLVFSGRTFNGIGLELTPGRYNITAFTGTLQNLSFIRDTIGSGPVILPTYKRKIQGSKLGYQKNGTRIELMGVRVVDETDPGSEIIPFLPLENFVIGANLNLRLFQKIQFSINGAGSLFSTDRNAIVPDDLPDAITKLNPFYTVNASSRASFAYESSLRYQHKGYFAGIRYRRLDPFYFSLATNYLQNDIENITLDFGLPLLSRKLNIRGSVGRQKDNLRNHKAFTNNRLIGSITANFSPSRKFQAVGRYANFQQETQSGLVEVNDTFKILVTTHNVFLNINWGIIDDDVRGVNFSFNVFNNVFIDEAARSFRDQDNNFNGLGTNGRLSYSYKPIDLSAGLLFNYNLFEFATYSQGRIGGGMHVSKSFFDKKLNTGLQFMRQQNLYDGKGNGNLTNLSLNGRLAIDRKHSFGMRIMYRKNESIITPSFREIRGSINYGYRF